MKSPGLFAAWSFVLLITERTQSDENEGWLHFLHDYCVHLLQWPALYPLATGSVGTWKQVDCKINCMAHDSSLVWWRNYVSGVVFVVLIPCVYLTPGNTSLTFEEAESFHPVFVSPTCLISRFRFSHRILRTYFQGSNPHDCFCGAFEYIVTH